MVYLCRSLLYYIRHHTIDDANYTFDGRTTLSGETLTLNAEVIHKKAIDETGLIR